MTLGKMIGEIETRLRRDGVGYPWKLSRTKTDAIMRHTLTGVCIKIPIFYTSPRDDRACLSFDDRAAALIAGPGPHAFDPVPNSILYFFDFEKRKTIDVITNSNPSYGIIVRGILREDLQWEAEFEVVTEASALPAAQKLLCHGEAR